MTLIDIADAYLPPIRALIKSSAGTAYRAHLLSPDVNLISAIPLENRAAALAEINHTYLHGILERAHIASITSITRLERWLSSTVNSMEQSNALGFAASLRGFLESASDANDVMEHLPTALSKVCLCYFALVMNPAFGSRSVILMEELENKLIHYTYASRRPKIGPVMPHHEVNSTADYIRGLEKAESIELGGLYSHLCELTHPAGASIACFLDEETGKVAFQPDQDSEVITKIFTNHEASIREMVSRAFNAPILCLSLLHRVHPQWQQVPDEMVFSIGKLGYYVRQLEANMLAVLSGKIADDEILSLQDG